MIYKFINSPDFDINTLFKHEYFSTRYTLLMELCKDLITDERLEMIAYILRRSDLNVNLKNNGGNTALYYLLSNIQCINNQIALELFLERPDVDVDLCYGYDDNNAIMQYVMTCRTIDHHIFERMLMKSKNLNVQNRYGNTVWHFCAKFHPMVITMLQPYAAAIDINLQNNQGETIVMWLLERCTLYGLMAWHKVFSNINFNLSTTCGSNALMYWLKLDRMETLGIPTYLLERGAEINYANVDVTALQSQRKYNMKRRFVLNIIKRNILVRHCSRKWMKCLEIDR